MKQPFMIRNGDRVAFWGDSITDNAAWCLSIENFVRCRHPRWKVDFLNLGWSGDMTRNWKRMERDLPGFRPTLVTIMLGMNDGEYKPFDESVCSAYLDGLNRLFRIVRTRSTARIVVITPTAYEEDVRPDPDPLKCVYVRTLRKLSLAAKALAASERIPVIDLNAGYLESLDDFRRKDPALRFSSDGVHPDTAGNAIMALRILEGMNAAPTGMSVRIDFASGRAADAVGQKISDVELTPKGLKFKRTPFSVPFRLEGTDQLGTEFAAWRSRIDPDLLMVTGLKTPYCLVEAGDRPLGVFSRTDAESGIDLSVFAVPENETAAFTGRLVAEKHACRYELWRKILLKEVQMPGDFKPFGPVDDRGRFLRTKASMIARFLNSGRIRCLPYKLTVRESETGDPFPDAPFKILQPAPSADEVQVLFKIDTSRWKDVLCGPRGQPLSFEPPLRLKGGFNGWTAAAMRDDGRQGDDRAGDGIWSLAVNVKRSGGIQLFAFDDTGTVRSHNESLLAETMKKVFGELKSTGRAGHPCFTPQGHMIVEITAAHFDEALKKGLLKLKS